MVSKPQRSLCLYLYPVLEIQVRVTITGFLCVYWASSSGAHVCTARALTHWTIFPAPKQRLHQRLGISLLHVPENMYLFFTGDSIWGYGYPCADTLFALRKQGLYYSCYGFIMEGLYSLERALIYSIRLDSYKRGFWKVVKSLSKGKYRDYSEVGTWRSGELPVKSNLGKKIAQQPYVDSSSIEKQ